MQVAVDRRSRARTEFPHVGLASPTSPPGRDSIPAPGGKGGHPRALCPRSFRYPHQPHLCHRFGPGPVGLSTSLSGLSFSDLVFVCLEGGPGVRAPCPAPHQGEEGAGLCPGAGPGGAGPAGRGAAGLLGGGSRLGTDADPDRRGRCRSASRAEAATRAEERREQGGLGSMAPAASS